MTCETHSKNAKLIAKMQGAIPLSVLNRGKKTYDKIKILGNNIDLVKDTAKIAKEVFGGLKNTSGEELKMRVAYFKAVCQEYLNDGEDIHVSIRPNLEKGIINMDYGRYFGEMTPFDTMCRGLYLDLKDRTDDGVLLLPMNKFFNYGEPNAPTDEFILSYTENIDFFEKIDGSMILARKTPNQEIHLATRRTYLSSEMDADSEEEAPYVKAAKRYLEQIGTEWMDTNKTYSFEIVFPEDEMQRPVQYENGLWVLSARDHTTGENLTSAHLQETELGQLDKNIVHFPKSASFEGMEDAYNYVKNLEGAEGFVGNFRLKNNKGLLRLKFKSPWWFAAHKTMSSKITVKNLRKIANLLSSSEQKHILASTLYGADVWDEEKINAVTIKTLRDFLTTNNRIVIDNFDDLSAMLKGQWKEARSYADQHIKANMSFVESKKSLFTDPTVPKSFRSYAGSMIDAYYGKSSISITDMLKYADTIIEGRKKQ